MIQIQSSETINYLMRTLIRVIGRRTSENFALETLYSAINELKPKYDFLKFIEIGSVVYSAELDAIAVKSEINYVDPNMLGKAINEVLDIIARSLGGSSDYDFQEAEHFLLTEVQDELGERHNIILKQIGINLDIKQNQFIIEMQEAYKIKIKRMKKTDVLDHILKSIIIITKKNHSEIEASKILVRAIKKYQKEYDFLKYLQIKEPTSDKDPYIILVNSEIDNIWSAKMAKAIQQIIEDSGKTTDLKALETFIDDLKNQLGRGDIQKIEKIGINLNQVHNSLQRQKNEIIFTKTIELIIDTIGEKTSIGFAVSMIDSIIEKLKDRHSVLNNIKIDKSLFESGIKAFDIMQEINNESSHDLARAIKDIMKNIQNNFADKSNSFIEDFKKKAPSDYISEIEKIGVNLHILELRKSLF